MPDDDGPQGLHPAARACRRCRAALEVALHLPARIGQPAYAIFRCAACGAVEWVAEAEDGRV